MMCDGRQLTVKYVLYLLLQVQLLQQRLFVTFCFAPLLWFKIRPVLHGYGGQSERGRSLPHACFHLRTWCRSSGGVEGLSVKMERERKKLQQKEQEAKALAEVTARF